ncbi:hypothetical protein D6774_01805 [Candidatus Woesearchaeota archaeon]|nr:MAG: hypothetical protein D6774_01805 [Candidatus Woesearchaeota archaeon]
MSIRVRQTNVRRISRHRSKRPKTFKTEEAAHAWAKANGIEKYTLKNLKFDSANSKKIRVVPLQE